MPTTRAPHPLSQPLVPSVTGHILVATQGSDAVAPEIRVARALADRFGSKIDVLSVVVPIVPTPLFVDMGLVGSLTPLIPPASDLEKRRLHVSDELARAGRPDWKVTVVAGWPGEKIAEVAKQLGATLIVMGIGRHAPIDRLMGSETTLEVIQQTEIPVLAVSRDLRGVPQSAVAAVDFTEQSEVAARVASELVADAGTLHLAHMRTEWDGVMDPSVPVDLYAEGVERRFEQLENRFAHEHVAPRQIERVFRTGDPAAETLAYASVHGLDLIAVGARSHSRMHRIFLGSVAAKVLRGAHCSVLVLPAKAELARRAQPSQPMEAASAGMAASGV